MLVHLQEALHLLADDFLDVFRDFLTLQVFQELLNKLLLLIRLLIEIRLEVFVNLLILLLSLLLVLLELVLFFQLRPNCKLADEVRKDLVGLIKSLLVGALLVDSLQLTFLYVN